MRVSILETVWQVKYARPEIDGADSRLLFCPPLPLFSHSFVVSGGEPSPKVRLAPKELLYLLVRRQIGLPALTSFGLASPSTTYNKTISVRKGPGMVKREVENRLCLLQGDVYGIHIFSHAS